MRNVWAITGYAIYNFVDELSQKRMVVNTLTVAHLLGAEMTEILRKIVFLALSH